MIELTSVAQRALRARAHSLNPVVSISGNGLTPSVLAEIDRSLKAHELIKIRVYGDDREARAELMRAVCEALDCAPVQMIGKLLVVFRPKPEEPVAEDAPRAAPRRPVTAKPRAARPGTATPGRRAPARPASGFGGRSAYAPARPRTAGRKPGPR